MTEREKVYLTEYPHLVSEWHPEKTVSALMKTIIVRNGFDGFIVEKPSDSRNFWIRIYVTFKRDI